jgi:aminopeptidase-like protein
MAEGAQPDYDGEVGRRLYGMVAQLAAAPVRSITGDGVRATLDLVRKALLGAEPGITFDVHEVPSGTPVLDWTVPQEWNVRAAYLIGPDGTRVADLADHPLHLLGYSVPTSGRFTLDELRGHLFSLPDHPGWIPYRTSYWNETWGFCLRDSTVRALPDGEYEVLVDTSLTDGSLTYAEVVVAATEPAEAGDFLLTTHVCHPAMANDNGSGIAILTELARYLAALPVRRHTFRLLFIPGTIGSITWLARNRATVTRIRHGLVLTGLGDRSPLTYKRSRRGDAVVDRAAAVALAEAGAGHGLVDFSPYGYDERQFCSPGFDLPVGRLGRGQHGEYPEYHTSADDLAFVTPEHLAGAFAVLTRILEICERDAVWRNTSPYGEPQLGRRGLYRAIGATMNRQDVEMALLWVLNLADGTRDLLDIAARAQLPFDAVTAAVDALASVGLLVRQPVTGVGRAPADGARTAGATATASPGTAAGPTTAAAPATTDPTASGPTTADPTASAGPATAAAPTATDPTATDPTTTAAGPTTSAAPIAAAAPAAADPTAAATEPANSEDGS